jgi:aerobic-type carbon monoxide dehydrogenase small subunit (CoxS/CutS family)
MNGTETALLSLTINGEERTVVAPGHHTLLEVLREECGMTGTKHGCELGECGTCTVLVGGRPVLSCLALAVEAQGRPIETVEGLQIGNQLHPLQAAFADLGAAQCGYCTPGILMVAKALLTANPRPGRAEIQEALAGNLCRCTGYHKIVEAVEWAAAQLRGESWTPPDETLYGAPVPEAAPAPPHLHLAPPPGSARGARLSAAGAAGGAIGPSGAGGPGGATAGSGSGPDGR